VISLKNEHRISNWRNPAVNGLEHLSVLFFICAEDKDCMKVEERNNSWTWVIAIAIVIGGIWFFTQWRNNNQQAEATKIIEAKQACQWDGKRQNWDAQAMATCDRLGTKGYTESTNDYYELYITKLKYGL